MQIPTKLTTPPYSQKIDTLAPAKAIAAGVILVFGAFCITYALNLTWWLAPALLGSQLIAVMLFAWHGQPIARMQEDLQQSALIDNTALNTKQRLSQLPEALREDLKLAPVPAGKFMMGSPAGEGHPDEHPQHQVELSAYYLGAFPVTQRLYYAVLSKEPPKKSLLTERLPVTNVSWYDAVTFCNALSVKLGLEPCYKNNGNKCDRSRNGFRLPSEAEWEYAAKAGTSTQYALPAPDGSDDISGRNLVNCDGGGSQWDGKQASPVGSFEPNGWGLHDMHGNVWEWTQDTWHSSYQGAPADGSSWESSDDDDRRVLRGGSWNYGPEHTRAAYRYRDFPVNRHFGVGFRVLCSGPL